MGMMVSLPEIYSLPLNQATIDPDHILLPSELAGFLPSQPELDLGDAGRIKVVRQGEVLLGKGLVRRLSRLGNLLQWSRDGDRLEVHGLILGRRETAAEEAAVAIGFPPQTLSCSWSAPGVVMPLRLSRIGQQQDVYIFNLSSRGTVEDHILEILDRKINLFELVVGELDLILGRLGEEKDLEETIMELVGTSRSDEDLRERLDQIGEQMQEAREQYERVRSLDDALVGEVVGG